MTRQYRPRLNPYSLWRVPTYLAWGGGGCGVGGSPTYLVWDIGRGWNRSPTYLARGRGSYPPLSPPCETDTCENITFLRTTCVVGNKNTRIPNPREFQYIFCMFLGRYRLHSYQRSNEDLLQAATVRQATTTNDIRFPGAGNTGRSQSSFTIAARGPTTGTGSG